MMRLRRTFLAPLGLLVTTVFIQGAWAAPAPGAGASLPAPLAEQKSLYQKRVADRYAETFRVSDRANAGRITREDVGGNIEFLAHFGDIDVNSDGIVTRDELSAYLQQHYGVRSN